MKDKALIIKYITAVVLGLLLAVTDQVTKYLAMGYLKYTGATEPVIKGFLSLTAVHNEGAAFGIMQGRKVLFVILTAAIFIAAIWYFIKYKPRSILFIAPVTLILSGALGNLVDRLLFGYVRDFIEFTFVEFPVFNVADCSICVGAGLLVIYAFIGMGREENE